MDKPEVIKQGLMQMISAGASKTDLVRTYGGMSLEQVLEARYPSLGRLTLMYGQEKTEKALAVLLLEASAAFEGSFDKETSLELAAEIKAHYYYLSLEDCYVCLQEMKTRKVYGKLTPNKVLVAVNDYADRRLIKAAEQSLNQHLAMKPSRGAPRQSEQGDKAFKDFEKQYRINKLKTQHTPPHDPKQ